MAGPGVILSFMIAGITSLLVAFCIAELSSAMPASGSAYTFTYVIFGEVWAWIVGWALVMELLLATAVVARVWSLFAAQMLADLGVRAPEPLAGFIGQIEGFDLFTLLILVLLTGVVALGARVGLRALWIIVIAKLVAIGAVIIVGATHFDQDNLAAIPAPPPRSRRPTTPCTPRCSASSSARRPRSAGSASSPPPPRSPSPTSASTWWPRPPRRPRTLPVRPQGHHPGPGDHHGPLHRGRDRGGRHDPVRQDRHRCPARQRLPPGGRGVHGPRHQHRRGPGPHHGRAGPARRPDAGGLLDGPRRALPRPLAKINRSYHSPTTATLVIGGLAILLAEFVPVLTLEPLVVIGTLFAFIMVAAGVIRMRRTMPDLPRGFRTPLSPYVPIASILASLWLMVNLQVVTWLYFLAWMAFGLLVYLVYGRRKSVLGGGSPPLALVDARGGTAADEDGTRPRGPAGRDPA
nr:hypothetical protein GCM10020093_075330 [Planobispora longispora]